MGGVLVPNYELVFRSKYAHRTFAISGTSFAFPRLQLCSRLFNNCNKSVTNKHLCWFCHHGSTKYFKISSASIPYGICKYNWNNGSGWPRAFWASCRGCYPLLPFFCDLVWSVFGRVKKFMVNVLATYLLDITRAVLAF